MSSAEVMRGPARRARGWLRLPYGVLGISALAFALMLLQDLLWLIEEDSGGELHHLVIFDLAWPVFVVSWLLTLVGGVVALVAWVFARRPAGARYALWALGFCAASAVVVAVAA